MRLFVLQAADADTGCPALEARFSVVDLATLCDVLGSEASDDPDLRNGYPLDGDHLTKIAGLFGVPFDPAGREVTLVPWQRLRELPYLVHTGFELALMLEGRKPLAVFADSWPGDWLEELIGRFDPFVESGRFLRRIIDRPGIREVYFSLPDHGWRIDAYVLLHQVGAKSGWNDALERYQGSLFGYEDWQNDYWVKWRRSVLGSGA